MKIAFLNIYNGLIDRGAERSTHELANRLAKHHKVYLIQGGQESVRALYKTKNLTPLLPRYQDTSVSFLRKFYLDIWSLQILIFTVSALSFLWKEDFQVIIPINGGWQAILCRLFTWIRRTKMVIIGRAGIGRDDAWNLLCRPDAFVALTSAAARWAKHYRKKINIHYIPNGVDIDTFHPKGKQAALFLNKPIIICVAACMPNKQIDLTIQAVTKLDKISLVVLGDGLDKNKLRALGRKLLGKGRFLLLHVEKEKIADYYHAADIFTLVSKTGEAFGNVYLEAMACNLPVVTVDDETRHEIVNGAGLFVDPNNIDTYAKALASALQNDFGDKPRKQAEKFSWERVLDKYEKLLSTLS